MRQPLIGGAVAAALVFGLVSPPARAAAAKVEVQGFGGPAPSAKPKLARRGAYAAAVALALYELAEQAHSVVKGASEAGETKLTTDFSFAKGLKISGWVRRSQALDTDSDLRVVLPKSRVWGAPQELHVVKSALAEPAPDKISITRLRWTLSRNGVKVRHVEYSDDNWATVNVSFDRAKLEKLNSAPAAKP